MRQPFYILSAFFSLCIFLPPPTCYGQSPVFYVKGKDLYTPDHERVLLRGVNKMIFYNERDGKISYREIAKTKANTVRIFWFTKGTAAELDQTLTNAISNQLIPIPSLWEATGKWGEVFQQCVDYWCREDIAAVIRKHQRYLILNIANEAGDGKQSPGDFRQTYERAVQQLRRAGIRTPLMIDAAGWGRQEEYLLQHGRYLLQNDSLSNLIFSWHPWDANPAPDRIRNAFDRANRDSLPFVVGEFAHKSVGCACCIDYKNIMALAQEKKIGWLAWEWGPGNSDCAEMDMTRNNLYESLHSWGLEVAVTDPNSIRNTSVRPGLFNRDKLSANGY